MAINANALHAVRYFIKSGFQPIHAFAIVGNDIQESLMKPAIVGDKMLKDAAHGIGQWRGSRFKALQAFAKKLGQPWESLDVQLQFQLAEIVGAVGTEKSHGKRLLATTDLESAVAAAISLFRPRGWSLKNPKAGHGWKNRLKNARDLEAHFKKEAMPVSIGGALLAPPPAAAPSVVIPTAEIIVRPTSVIDSLPRLIPPMVEQGDQGEAVLALQQALATLGYKLKGTGFFGPATDSAVRDYQRSRGLDVDGQVGKDTVAALVARRPAMPDMPQADERPLWLLNALGNIGTKEAPGKANNPKIMAWAKAEGGQIAKTYTGDAIPWCALGTNHDLTKAGLRGTETLWALDFHSDTKWPNVRLAGPALGAIMTMKREGGGHVCICAGRTKDGYLAGVGYNQGDAVSVDAFPKDRPLSFRWPARTTLPAKIGFAYLPVVNTRGVSIKEN